MTRLPGGCKNIYHWRKCPNYSYDYVKKQIRLLFYLLLDISVEVINTSVTH
jgi:hypothetical protein